MSKLETETSAGKSFQAWKDQAAIDKGLAVNILYDSSR